MKFDELDTRMRVFETAHDHCVLPGIRIVARLDGRGFTRLTKETLDLQTPFDERFRDAMSATTAHAMDCGFRVVFGYHQSDEISLLFHPDDDSFGRKTRKLESVLAGEASARFSIEMGVCAAFDCRISQLPSDRDVVDYFRWRSEDAHRNALNAHCYWILRSEGQSANDATTELLGISAAHKNELLFQRGINFNDLPAWQKRGVGLRWERVVKRGENPKTGETTTTTRRQIATDLQLPMRDEFEMYIRELLESAGADG